MLTCEKDKGSPSSKTNETGCHTNEWPRIRSKRMYLIRHTPENAIKTQTK